MFTLRIFIYGLIAIMPQADGSREVLLVATDSGTHGPKHTPFLVAKAEACEDLTENGINDCHPDQSSRTSAADWNQLENADVQLSGLGNDDVDIAKRTALGLGPPIYPQPMVWTELEDGRWILPLSEMLGRKHYDPNRVTTKIPLHGGTLKTCHLSTLYNGDLPIGRAAVFFVKHPLTPLPWGQVLADMAAWEREVADDYLDIAATPLHSGGPNLSIRLTPKSCSSRTGRCIDLFVGNEASLIYRHAGFGPNPDEIAGHFDHYYELFSWTSTKDLPATNAMSRMLAVPSWGFCGLPLPSLFPAVNLSDGNQPQLVLKPWSVTHRAACPIVQ